MIPNIDSKPTIKPFKDVSGIFVTVNFDGNYLTWVKIPEVFDSNAAKGWNAYRVLFCPNYNYFNSYFILYFKFLKIIFEKLLTGCVFCAIIIIEAKERNNKNEITERQ